MWISLARILEFTRNLILRCLYLLRISRCSEAPTPTYPVKLFIGNFKINVYSFKLNYTHIWSFPYLELKLSYYLITLCLTFTWELLMFTLYKTPCSQITEWDTLNLMNIILNKILIWEFLSAGAGIVSEIQSNNACIYADCLFVH